MNPIDLETLPKQTGLKNFLWTSPWPGRLIQIGLGLVFAYAGIVKLIDPKAFARIISHYGLIPTPFLSVVAIGLPVLELLAGVGIILGVRGSLSVILSLLLLFVTVLWYGILKNLDVDCGCFSVEDLKGQAGLWNAFYRDLIMIAAAVLVYVSRWIQVRRKMTLPLGAKIKLII